MGWQRKETRVIIKKQFTEVMELEPEDTLVFQHDPLHVGENHKHEIVPVGRSSAHDGDRQTDICIVTCDTTMDAVVAVVSKQRVDRKNAVTSMTMGFEDVVGFIHQLAAAANVQAELCAIEDQIVIHVVGPLKLDAIDEVLASPGSSKRGNA